jgi:glucose-6-phosphate 1-dehydrogenase
VSRAAAAFAANYVRFQLSPDVTIAIGARVKGLASKWSASRRSSRWSTVRTQKSMDAYERLLGDAMDGDGTLFARQDGVEAAWAIVQPILGTVTPVYEYEPGTWGPAEAEGLLADVGGWHNPTC